MENFKNKLKEDKFTSEKQYILSNYLTEILKPMLTQTFIQITELMKMHPKFIPQQSRMTNYQQVIQVLQTALFFLQLIQANNFFKYRGVKETL